MIITDTGSVIILAPGEIRNTYQPVNYEQLVPPVGIVYKSSVRGLQE